MPTKKLTTAGKWIDPDEIPPLDKEWFERGEIRDGERVIRPGRPKAATPKHVVNIRLDADLVAHYRATGPGWQSRINDVLRKAAHLPRRKARA